MKGPQIGAYESLENHEYYCDRCKEMTRGIGRCKCFPRAVKHYIDIALKEVEKRRKGWKK